MKKLSFTFLLQNYFEFWQIWTYLSISSVSGSLRGNFIWYKIFNVFNGKIIHTLYFINFLWFILDSRKSVIVKLSEKFTWYSWKLILTRINVVSLGMGFSCIVSIFLNPTIQIYWQFKEEILCIFYHLFIQMAW